MLVALCRSLEARGIPQHVVTLTEGGANRAVLEAAGIPVHGLAPRGPLGAGTSAVSLALLIRRLRPAVLQGWLYHGDLLSAVSHRFAGTPASTLLAWGLRNSDIDHARYGRLLLAGRYLSRWPGIVISNSQAGADFHLAQGYRPQRLAVIPNGINTDRFRPDHRARAVMRAELGIAHNSIVAVHAARLDPMKDHVTLLEAASRVPGVSFLLAGAGTETLDLPPNAVALGRRDDLDRLYAAADVVVSTSAFGEGFSNALAEGMAAGLVPVATHVGDAKLILSDIGHLVSPKDPAAIAAAILELSALPVAERRGIGEAARARIETRFGVAAMADNFLAAWNGAGAVLNGQQNGR